MFDKEAVKDYMDNLRGKLEVNNESRLEEQFEDTFVRGAIYGYNKANEWHYVKDGINPTHPYGVLVFTDEGVGLGIYGLDDKKWHTYDTGFEVIAWKEIVLPKEIE